MQSIKLKNAVLKGVPNRRKKEASAFRTEPSAKDAVLKGVPTRRRKEASVFRTEPRQSVKIANVEVVLPMPKGGDSVSVMRQRSNVAMMGATILPKQEDIAEGTERKRFK